MDSWLHCTVHITSPSICKTLLQQVRLSECMTTVVQKRSFQPCFGPENSFYKIFGGFSSARCQTLLSQAAILCNIKEN